MKKIPTLFKRDPENRMQITPEVNPAADWVLEGGGVIATRKYDGTAILVHDGWFFQRHTKNPGKMPPLVFVEVDHDPVTGQTTGWVPVPRDQDQMDKRLREALTFENVRHLSPGTYELIGPKVNGNPEHCDHHRLVPHRRAEPYAEVPTKFDQLREWLRGRDIEGLVWHHSDGRMAKIKMKDFDLPRVVAVKEYR